MDLVYRATILPLDNGGFELVFEDVPEAITCAPTRSAVIHAGQEALGLALRGYLVEGRQLPQPRATEGVPIAVGPEDAAKILVISRFRALGITKRDLARRLGKAENEAHRILDPDHPSKVGILQQALVVMGQSLVLSVLDAA